MIEKLLFYQKTYDLILRLYPVINRLPKSHRQVLGKKLEETSLNLLILIINANKKSGLERFKLQKEISDQLDILRILIRLTKDLRFMSIKQYLLFSEKTNELARILKGWMKV